MRFIYFYSDIYEFYHNHLQETLRDHFELIPTKIYDISTNSLGHTFLMEYLLRLNLLYNP